ncbi:hypothetical protein [Streptomyces pseudogriseolus]|uniref:hypothetical protein n=1 Tax=Streptomyces pseudogriseolus TaxID=36817 RepID=UPI003FA2AB5F
MSETIYGWQTRRCLRDGLFSRSAMCGDREAVALDRDRSAKWVALAGVHEMVRPEIVLGFHGLCLVKPSDDDDWYMGSLYDDGSIDCWAAFDDLYEALRGL